MSFTPKKIYGSGTPGQAPSSGSELVKNFNDNFDYVKSDLEEKDKKIVLLEQGESIYNVTAKVPPVPGSYYTAATARAAVPTGVRKLGLVITYQTSATTWITEQFFQGSISTWATDTNWKSFGAGGNITLTYTNDVATTRKLVSVSDRKQGAMISYYNGTELITEQYKSTIYTDTEWVKDTNWMQLADAYTINKKIDGGEILSRNFYTNNLTVLYPSSDIVYRNCATAILASKSIDETIDISEGKSGIEYAIKIDVSLQNNDSTTNNLYILVQYTGYSAYHTIDQSGSFTLNKFIKNDNITTVRLRIQSRGTCVSDLKSIYIGSSDYSYTSSTVKHLNNFVSNDAKLTEDKLFIGDIQLSPTKITETFKGVSKLCVRFNIVSSGEVSIQHTSSGHNQTQTYSIDNSGFIFLKSFPIVGGQASISISGSAVISDVLITTDVDIDVSTDFDRYFKYSLYDIKNNKPVNMLPNNGILRQTPMPIGNTFLNGKCSFTKVGTNILFQIPPVDYDRYIYLIGVSNLTGKPNIVYRTTTTTVATTIVSDKNYILPAGCFDVMLSLVAGDRLDVTAVYLGKERYTDSWYEEKKPVTKDNYFPNIDLVGIPNRFIDERGNISVRIWGNNSEQEAFLIFDKTQVNDWASIILRSNTEVSITTLELTSGGGASGGIITNNLVEKCVVSRKFSENPKIKISIKFNAASDKFIDISSPAITTSERLVDDILITKSNNIGDGINIYDSIEDLRISGKSSGIIGYSTLVTKTKNDPISNLDYNVIGAQPLPKNKLHNIKYCNLDTFLFGLITSKGRKIFHDRNKLYYTDGDVQGCLKDKTIVDNEERWVLDTTKLTLYAGFTAINQSIASIRELSNGDILVLSSMKKCYVIDKDWNFIGEYGFKSETVVGGILNGWGVDSFEDKFIFSSYSAAPNYGKGSIMLFDNTKKTWVKIFDVERDGATLLGATAQAQTHIHGCFIDKYTRRIVMLLGDYSYDSKAIGKVIYTSLDNPGLWSIVPANFAHGPREQYCTGYSLPNCVIFGTDHNETCVARKTRGVLGYNCKSEAATELINGLNFIPNFTPPIAENPIGIHMSYTIGDTPSHVYITKDGYNFTKIFQDTVPHVGFGNNNARVWVVGNLCYICQHKGRFENELILGLIDQK